MRRRRHDRSANATRIQHLVFDDKPAAYNCARAGRARASLAEVVRQYGLRICVEQSYQQVKLTLGWAHYQVRSSRAIQRHPLLVYCAFAFCWWQAAQQSSANGLIGDSALQPTQAHIKNTVWRKNASAQLKIPRHHGPASSAASEVGWNQPSCSSAIGALTRHCAHPPNYRFFSINSGKGSRLFFTGLLVRCQQTTVSAIISTAHSTPQRGHCHGLKRLTTGWARRTFSTS